MSPSPRRRVVTVCLATLLAVGASSAYGARPVHTPVDLSAAGQTATGPQVAVNSAGEAVAVWERSNGGRDIVEASIRPPGGSFSIPVKVSRSGFGGSFPQVAVDDVGGAIAVWRHVDGKSSVVQSAMRPAGGRFSAPVTLSTDGLNAYLPQVAMNAAGDQIVVWQSESGRGFGSFVVQAAVRQVGGRFSAPVTVSTAGQDGEGPQAAIDRDGDATVIWQGSAAGGATTTTAQAVEHPAGGTFSDPVTLSAPGQDIALPQIAMSGAGETFAIWQRSLPGGKTAIQVVQRPVGQAFSLPSTLTAVNEPSVSPQIAIDDAGNAVAVWEGANAGNSTVQAAVRPAGGRFSAPATLSVPRRNASSPQVAIDETGGAVAVWERFNGAQVEVQRAQAPAGRPFSAPAGVSTLGFGGGTVQVGIDRTGDALAVWDRNNGRNTVVQARASRTKLSRVQPPRPRLKAPARARVGQRVAVIARDFKPGRYVLRLVRQGNPGGESTPCTANLTRRRRVGRRTILHGRVPARLVCRLHGVGPALGTVPVAPGAGYRFTLCIPEGSACSAAGSFVSKAVRIVR